MRINGLEIKRIGSLTRNILIMERRKIESHMAKKNIMLGEQGNNFKPMFAHIMSSVNVSISANFAIKDGA